MNNLFFPTSMRELHAPVSTGTRVAIITRTKDRPILLARAFASVLLQTHQDWHLYLVNDGGDPGPVDRLIEQYRPVFAGRITVQHHPHSLGMEEASNSALAMAVGDFVIIHDDDDGWHPEFLSDTVGFLNRPKNMNYAAVLTNCVVIHERIENDRVVEESRHSWGYWKDKVDFADIASRNTSPPICLLIRKTVIDAVGHYNGALPVLGDWDYMLRILMVGDVGVINKPLAYYHHRLQARNQVYGNSVTAGGDQHQVYDTLYRNSMVRTLLQKQPDLLGLITVLMRHGEEQHNSTRYEIQQLRGEIQHMMNVTLPVLRQTERALTPLRWIWRLLYPLRRIIAKLRGRI